MPSQALSIMLSQILTSATAEFVWYPLDVVEFGPEALSYIVTIVALWLLLVARVAPVALFVRVTALVARVARVGCFTVRRHPALVLVALCGA